MTRKSDIHDLFKTGDPDAPDAIKDRNGEVVLSMCRRCRAGEIELQMPCRPSVSALLSGLMPRIRVFQQLPFSSRALTQQAIWVEADAIIALLLILVEEKK